MAPIFGYWDCRSLAAPIRYMLEYAGVEYKEKLYSCGPPPDFDRSQWLDEKFTLGLDFPNLPYYIDGDVKLTQSGVIMAYLARKHGLQGKNESDQCRIELLYAQLRDYHMDYGKLAYAIFFGSTIQQFAQMKADYEKGMPDKMKALSKFMGDRKFVAGDYVTFVDFFFFEYLEGQVSMMPDLLKDYPVLDQYHKRFAALEPIDKYFKSGRAIKYPFNGAPATIGGQYSDELLLKSV